MERSRPKLPSLRQMIWKTGRGGWHCVPGVTMKPAIVIHPGAEWLELSWWSRVKHDDDEASHDDAAGYTDGFPGGGGHQQEVSGKDKSKGAHRGNESASLCWFWWMPHGSPSYGPQHAG
ncbi:hypothetical protein An16g05410 [Aspergillus niger]|uniref:Uncharacterized protein n=2 Tax=Aspergillus niger TaxID=5061 RepID=A2R807_ASPNC|nr:hypothetical protein An16g05410 [Aspergillus niger]CAK46881.1 hypothetical protein An16g05410 [Aspergillus niger]